MELLRVGIYRMRIGGISSPELGELRISRVLSSGIGGISSSRIGGVLSSGIGGFSNTEVGHFLPHRRAPGCVTITPQ